MDRRLILIALFAFAISACSGRDPSTACEFDCMGFPFPSGFNRDECKKICEEAGQQAEPDPSPDP